MHFGKHMGRKLPEDQLADLDGSHQRLLQDLDDRPESFVTNGLG